jgi:hypothetical protein
MTAASRPSRTRRLPGATSAWNHTGGPSQAASSPSCQTRRHTSAGTVAPSSAIERTQQTIAAWSEMNGLQGGDPAKLAAALVKLVSSDELPVRWAADADAVGVLEEKDRKAVLHHRTAALALGTLGSAVPGAAVDMDRLARHPVPIWAATRRTSNTP